jgi:(E)-4-hydroxy-3-methylbut-2-enyl-diphosphate synthase
MAYCVSRFRTIRRRTVEVKIGAVGVGGDNPIRLQSMTTSDTQDVAATVQQSIALAEAGCEIVRVTAPNVPAAECLRAIRAQFTAAGFGHVPLVADIHFLPQAAMAAVEHVEKIRVNPGNYADKKKFAVREYTDGDYDRELQRLHEAFSPLVLRCQALGRALRIGTNHGSLSDRILNRYGDTPLGMVESALEFVRICESHGFHDLVLSMKASNPKIMIQAYRLLAERLDAAHRPYPLHLGVTEAGDGEDGRIKGAIGIGSLLLDGLGDTIRVSLTEDSVYEIPVARAIAEKAMSLWRTSNVEPSTPDVQSPASAQRAQLPIDGGASGMGILPMSEGSTQSHGQDARATASLRMPPTIGSCAPAQPEVESSKFAVARSELATADSIDPYLFTRRATIALHLGDGITIGPEQPPRVIVRVPPGQNGSPLSAFRVPLLKDTPIEGVLLAIDQPSQLATLPHVAPACLVLDLGAALTPADLSALAPPLPAGTLILRRFAAADRELLIAFAHQVRGSRGVLGIEITPDDLDALGPVLRELGDDRLLFTLSAFRSPLSAFSHALGGYRRLAENLRGLGLRSPIWIRNTTATAVQSDPSFLSRLLEASFLTGGLLCDGVGDLVSIETEADPVRAAQLAYNVLQGAGARSSKTEFVACPSCGRTLFDLQTTTQRIRAQTGHLKGVKIAIMGCIVNGPGEMADADFGYVGGAPGRINLYVGKRCVQFNVPQAEADERLIALIREHGRWRNPDTNDAKS